MEKKFVALVLVGGILVFSYWYNFSREDVPSDGDGADEARIELQKAEDDNGRIQERIGEAKSTACAIEESAVRIGELACDAETILADCERITGAIRSRAEENPS